jgi:hypothetical protein
MFFLFSFKFNDFLFILIGNVFLLVKVLNDIEFVSLFVDLKENEFSSLFLSLIIVFFSL